MNLLDDRLDDGDHALLRLHVGASELPDASDDGYDGGTRPHTRRRRKIGKTIQLILLRKYVQCARQLNRLPDRATTEQLLEQGYDEFYYQGGNLSEPRLSYKAFLKLVRNRRSEVAKQTREGGGAQRSRRHQKEQTEIRALIDDLENVRHGETRTLEYDALGPTSATMHSVATDAAVPILSDSSSIMDATDGGVSAADLSTAETYSSVMTAPSSSDDVVLSRAKLDLMLRVAQETLIAQKKILEEVRALEQRVAGIH